MLLILQRTDEFDERQDFATEMTLRIVDTTSKQSRRIRANNE